MRSMFSDLIRRLTEPAPQPLSDADARHALAALLVFFDPLIAHYNLSILPDSIALSASLCFCACLTLLAPERPRCSLLALSGLALFAFVAAGRNRDRRQCEPAA